MSRKRAQSSIELVIVMAAAFFFIASFIYAVQVSVSDKARVQRDLAVADLALKVQDEISIASSASNGYVRTFILPDRVVSRDYDIIVSENLVYIRTVDGKHAVSFQVANVTGSVNKGANVIAKVNGTIVLNG